VLTTALLQETVEAQVDDRGRARVFAGEVLHVPARPAAEAFRAHAWAMVEAAFAPCEPHAAQHELSIEAYVSVLARLKPDFCHDPVNKQLLGAMLVEAGCDPETTYFDLPKLRVVTSDGYLTSGLGYAYRPHRDTWYAAPASQVNWWTPLTPVQPNSTLAFHPQWWETPVANDSDGFDAYAWNSGGRANAAQFITSDTRNHPQAPLAFDPAVDTVVLPAPGESVVFSAAHLHSTVPNTSGRTRFSVDFRTISLSDLARGRGARLVDTASTGTTLRDFLRVADHAPVPMPLVRRYDVGSAHQGALVYTPTRVPAQG
jgi:hypothetical protein